MGRVLSFLALAVFLSLSVTRLKAEDPANPKQAVVDCVEASPDVWEISTRHLVDRPRCIDPFNPGFRVHRFESGYWSEQSIDRVLNLDDRLPIFYVHGNFMEHDNARQRVVLIDQYLRPRAHRPYRLIMLSWPSQREPHPLQDIRENADSADCQSLFFAWILQRIGDTPQVSILGFSLGARSVSGGMHLASGGTIRGLQYTPTEEADRPKSLYRIGFVAPAVDRTWLTPSGKHRLAMQRTESIVNLYNSNDPVLRRYRLLDIGSHAIAAGYEGFVGNSVIQQYDCSPCVGRTHDERSYFRQCPFFGQVLDHLLWKESLGPCRIP